jgi:hypothetical protein
MGEPPAPGNHSDAGNACQNTVYGRRISLAPRSDRPRAHDGHSRHDKARRDWRKGGAMSGTIYALLSVLKSRF